MSLYSYAYLTHSSNTLTDIFIWLAIGLGLTILFFGIKYLRNRTNLKNRDIFLAALAAAGLLICIQVSRIQTQQSSSSQVGQTVQIMKNVSHQEHVPISKVFTNSTNFQNGMLIKAGKHYYSVNATNDNTAYHLSKAHPISHKITYITKNKFHFNFNFNDDQYWNVALKFLIGLIMFVLQINFLGKNNLAPSNAVDQIENYVLGGVIGGVLYNPAITLLQFVIIILMWSVIVFGSRILMDRSLFFKKVLQGTPQVVVNDGHINVDALLKNGMSASDLVFKLRSSGIKNLENVKRVILEQNGQLSIDNIHDKDASYPLIIDGHINTPMLKHMHHSKKWLLGLLKLKKHELKDVFLGQIVDGELSLTYYPKLRNKQNTFAPKHLIDLKTYEQKFIKKLDKIKQDHKNKKASKKLAKSSVAPSSASASSAKASVSNSATSSSSESSSSQSASK